MSLHPDHAFDRLVIAIDGPSGSGKSSTSRGVAQRLGLRYLDTGAMFRAMTWWLLREGVDVHDPAAVAARVEEPEILSGTDPAGPSILVDGIDVGLAIRSDEVNAAVSPVSTVPEVRARLLELQREVIGEGGIVVEGRDIGSVVAPDADVKVFLTADAAARAERRAAEAGGTDLEATRESLLARDEIDSGRAASPLIQAEGAVAIDGTAYTLDEVIALVVALVDAGESAPLSPVEVRPDPMPSSVQKEHMTEPVLAVVGRPNVGKSTLVNRIIGRREAVVEDVPGVTRDRVSYDANWNGRAFTVIDTGGWVPEAKGMAERITEQAEIAVSLADAVLFVVDATVGITDADEAVVKILRRSNKPVLLAANKVDDQRAEAEAYALWNLGLGEPYPVSALHGRGSGDMLDAILKALPEAPMESFEEVGGPRRIAIVGRAQRRQVLAAEQAGGGGARGRRQRRRHDRRPGRRAGRAGRSHLAVHRHRRHPQAGQGGLRPRVLRLAAHVDGHRPGGGGRAGDRRQPVGLRAGPADHPDDPRVRPGAGHRLQQVGPRRRGAPLLPRP